ncbi:MAG: glycosyltransferase, partial [Ilumatobacteraceae bacterium]
LAELADQASAAELRQQIEFVGEPDDEELWNLYERSDILVSASLHEGLCVPVIEAYLAGCRVVGTTAGNLPYVVAAPDPVVPPGDPQALATALRSVIEAVLDGSPHDASAVEPVTNVYSTANSSAALDRELARIASRIG